MSIDHRTVIEKLTFRALALRQSELQWRISPWSIRSDEGLTLKTSAFQSLYGGQFTLSTLLINQIFVDMLSRAYLEGKPSVCALKLQDVERTDELSVSPERLEAIKSATASDPVLQSLCEAVKHGWPHE